MPPRTTSPSTAPFTLPRRAGISTPLERIVQLLIQDKAFVNCRSWQDANGNELECRKVPLHDAAGQGHATIVLTLLEAKANPLGYGENDYLRTTPFAFAITNGHAPVAMLQAPLVAQAQAKQVIGPCRHVGALFDATGRGLTGITHHLYLRRSLARKSMSRCSSRLGPTRTSMAPSTITPR